MATDSQKPTSQTLETENPNKTLTSTNPSNLTDDSNNNPSSTTQSESTDEKEANDLNVKVNSTNTEGTQPAVVSPTGADNDIQKKVRRAERFGVPVQLSEKEKRNSRAERFGTATGSEASKGSEEQKRKARAERFGLSVPTEDEGKKKARLAKFGSEVKIDTVEEEKRKARALRFSQTPSNNVPHINHEGDVGQKTAVAGNGTGGT